MFKKEERLGDQKQGISKTIIGNSVKIEGDFTSDDNVFRELGINRDERYFIVRIGLM